MKAIRVHQFGGPAVLRLEQVAEPQAGAGEVLVRIHAIGINPVEAYIRSGKYARMPSLPYTPGSDGAGTVERIGADVAHVKAGDRVYLSGSVTGTYAELAVCRAADVHPLPDPASFQQGAALGIAYATAYRALFDRGHARPGEIVLVHGASGGVGTACVQLAHAAGLTVVGTAGTKDGMELVREQGADHVLNHTVAGDYDRLQQITGGAGLDLIIEMLANQNLGRDLKLLARNGRVVVVGSRGPVEIDARDTMGRDAEIRGMTLFNATERDLFAIHAAIRSGLSNGTLRPIVGRELPLAEAARAHELLMNSPAHGKIVLIP
jgi:NADPH2:quinone reductase